MVNDDLIQCVLFGGHTRDANLIGVEYIVSQLVAPGLPGAAEKALMKKLLNGYGGTWHPRHTGRHGGAPDGRPRP